MVSEGNDIIRQKQNGMVLILILLEDGQWDGSTELFNSSILVLILILLEDGQWEEWNKQLDIMRTSRLNPYSIGRWSVSEQLSYNNKVRKVLILILLEDGQWVLLKSM